MKKPAPKKKAKKIAKKAPAKRATKPTPKKAAPKRAAKPFAKKPVAKKPVVKKPAPKKAPAKKPVAKKPVPKKVIKKSAKPVAKKVAPKKAAPKKAAPKKAVKKPVVKKLKVKKATKPIAKKAPVKKPAAPAPAPAPALTQAALPLTIEKQPKPTLEKAYEPQAVEDRTYMTWEKSGFFNPDKLPGKRDEAFTVIMPPPNATGTLHIGHAMFVTLQDVMTRFNRMNGKAALWLPGTDHAAIATGTKVEKILAKEGKTKYDLGRDGFRQRVDEFVAGSQTTIRRQIRKMGASCDWSREAYTLDEPRSAAVAEMFARMYQDGLIYRGYRIVNWCPRCESTLADDEVQYQEQDGQLYFMKYGPFTVATTRPETKLGDTGVAAHPDDARYKDWIGKTITVDFGSGPLEIKVIADESVEMGFGSGLVGLTPAHSAVDFAMGEKNGLAVKKVIGEDGRMTDLAGKYAGLPVLEARAKLVADLTAQGLIEKIEPLKNNISTCYRCSTPIEPLTSRQWFVDVNRPVAARKKKTLKELSVNAVRSGQIRIMPDRFEKVYYHWMENLRDWCISRQIWFGHRIPVWYCEACYDQNGGGRVAAGEAPKHQRGLYVGTTAPAICPDCGAGAMHQDPDTLDTWFSSGMWTFSTLGWPNEKAKDLKKFHPTQVMETSYDILFFWVARMILMTEYALGEVPFETVYLHGLVRDDQGRKMSKSLENIIDPLDVSAKYGTDAVRLSLVLGNTPGNDQKMSEEKIAYFRNFANKLWNMARFIQMNVPGMEAPAACPKAKSLADRWILGRLDATIASVTADLAALEFSRASESLRDFTWNELADWYLEIAKIERGKEEILPYLLLQTIKMWHPFMPFVTEEIYRVAFSRGGDDLLMVAEWPKASCNLTKADSIDFELVRSLVTALRNVRSEYKVEPAKTIDAVMIAGVKDKVVAREAAVIAGLARVADLGVRAKGAAPEKAVAVVVDGVQVFVPLGKLVDAAAEQERLAKELAEAEKYLAAQRAKLSNQDFVTRAPAQVIAGERAKLAAQEDKVSKLKEQLAQLLR